MTFQYPVIDPKASGKQPARSAPRAACPRKKFSSALVSLRHRQSIIGNPAAHFPMWIIFLR